MQLAFAFALTATTVSIAATEVWFEKAPLVVIPGRRRHRRSGQVNHRWDLLPAFHEHLPIAAANVFSHGPLIVRKDIHRVGVFGSSCEPTNGARSEVRSVE